MTLHLVEVSDVLSKLQAEKLCSSFEKSSTDTNYYQHGKTDTGVEIYWYRSYHDLKIEKFSLIVAHEFFDALPIHKFQVRSQS